MHIAHGIKLCSNFIKLGLSTLWPKKIDNRALKVYPMAPKPYHAAPKFGTGCQELGLNETKYQV